MFNVHVPNKFLEVLPIGVGNKYLSEPLFWYKFDDFSNPVGIEFIENIIKQ